MGSKAAVAHVTGGPCCEFHLVVSGRVWMGICKGVHGGSQGPLCGGSTEFVPGMFASGSVAHPVCRADTYIPGNRCCRCGTPTSSAWWWCRRWFRTQPVWWVQGTGSSPTFRGRQEEGPRSRAGSKRQSRQEPSAAANWRRRHESLAPLRLHSRLRRNSGIS